MLKKITFKKIAITSMLLLLAIILYNYPEEINEPIKEYTNSKINIYLIDENDFVAMTKIPSKEVEDVNDKIYNLLNALIIENNYNILPKGFKAVIPKNTKILDYDLRDGILKVNFSKEFLETDEKNENKMIESLIFTMTTLKQINKIMIFVEGEHLNELPKSHKPLGLYLDRSYGINKKIDISSINDTSLVTVYYLNKKDDYYYIPVSYVTNDTGDKTEIIINNLKSNKLNDTNLLSHLSYQVELMNYEATEKEILLDFNSVLLDSVYQGKLKEEVKYAISYSIMDTLGVENVIFMVNSIKIDEFILDN